VTTPPRSLQSKILAVAIVAAIVALAPGASRAILGAAPAQTAVVQADAFVSASAPTKRYGSTTSLKVDRTPRTAYLRFAVSTLTSAVTKATLRVYALKGSASPLDVRAVADNSWVESSLTYATAPPPSTTVTASSGAIAAGWVDLDVTPLVSGNGTYSFALTSASRTSVSLAARERGSSTAAQLVVQQVSPGDTTPPTAPTNLVTAGATATSVNLSWSASSDDVGVSGYRVYRDATLLGSTAQTTYTAGGLSCGTSYTFEVEAFDAANNASPRTAVKGTTSACPDTVAPSAPTGLSVVATSDTSVWITWSASTDNVGVTGYDVYVGSSKAGSTPSTSYTFGGLACGIAYTFGVEARDAAGNASARATLPAATAACPTGSAHTYYVDSAGGNDAGAGSSPSTAWKSLANVNNASLGPGDTVLLKRGGVWNGSLKVSASGTSSSPITVGSYGTGELPVVGGVGVSSCVVVSGSYVVVRELHADDCSWAGIQVSGSQVRVERSVLSRNAAGVHIEAGSVGAAVVDNDIVDNNKMSILTASPTNDDSGAFGILLNGDGAEVTSNRISGSDAFSYDYGRDGAAIEVYGGRNNTVHHNQAFDNHDFTELGNPRSQDNTFAYNLVRSTLQTASFLVTRGGQTSLGPVLRTHVYNNTVYLTGSSSQGFVCYSGCSADVLTMRNNVIQAVWKVGYADAPFDENNDLFWGGVLHFTKGAASVVANPLFVDATAQDLHLQAGSAAVDRGVGEGYTFDLDRAAVPKDGNGDGVAMPDDGVFERPAASTQADTSAPSAPGNLAATGATASGVTLSWSAATDNVGVAGYRVYRDGALVGSTGALTYSVTGLSCGTKYTLGVEAYDAAGNTSARTSTSATTTSCTDTTPPTAPTMLAAAAATQTSVTLSWIASTDNIGVTGYGVYLNGTLIGSTSTTTYAFGSLSCGTSYTLAVDAVDAAGNRSAKTSLTTATSPCTDTTPPTPPGNLKPSGSTATSISVSWSASTDNVGVAGYNVYVNGTKVGTTTATAYTFSGLVCGTTYTLGVEATDTSGLVSGRTSLTTATSACPTGPPSSGPCGTTTAPPSSWQHVVWVVMENKQYGQIIGSPSAPYINSLASQCSLATSFYAVAHPSLPNYIAMVSGSTQGITDDSGPSSHPLSAASIFSQLGSGGWKSLEEDMPSNCYMSNSGNYAVRHNPATYFTNITSQCAAQDVALGSTPDLSARFTFVTPNICNDMHSCPTQSDVTTEVKTGDTWLSTFIPKLTSSAEYKAGNTVIVLTWDEDDYSTSNANHIATIVISPSTPAGAKVATRYDHYSLLRTTEELLGLPFIANAASAGSMAADFHLR
jgi:chitodextrinase